MNLDPSEVAIGALFSGVQISVSGIIPADSEVLILTTGGKEDLTLRTKGRAFRVLWMNLGSVTFHNAPSLYLLHASKGIENFAASNPVQWQKLGFGLESLKDQVKITPNTADQEALYREFLKMKEGEGLYAVRYEGIRYGKTEDGMRSFEADILIPARVHPGEYEIRVLALKGGSSVAAATKGIKVREVGVPAFLSSLSFNHGSLYGVLAVLIAIGAGLLMDFFFGDHKGPH